MQVGGAYGFLNWTNQEDMAMDVEKYEFMLLEHETDFDDESPMTHPLDRDIQVHLMSRSGQLSKSMINILQMLNKRFFQSLPECQVYLACKKCPIHTSDGFRLKLEEGFYLKPNFKKTCREGHELDCMKLWIEQLNFEQVLENGIKLSEKRPFHQMKKEMKTGDQLLNYSDSTSKPCNPGASSTPYADLQCSQEDSSTQTCNNTGKVMLKRFTLF